MLHALRSIGPSIIGLLRTRLELFGIELAEEKGRAAQLAVLGALALLFAGLGLLMVNVLVLALFWDTHRFLAIAGLIVAYGGLALLCVSRLQSALAARPPMFEATLAELKADVEALSRVRQQ
jgi:uncharacterized membrane protein YqjE